MKARLALHVESLEETVTFYGAAFGFARISPQIAAGYVTLRLDESELHFIETAVVESLCLEDVEAPPSGLPQGSEIVLVVSHGSLAEIFSRAVDAGALPVRPPLISESGRHEAFLRDPNGFLITLRQVDAF